MKNPKIIYLAVGDLVILALVTLYGFATHQETDAGWTRMLTTFLPLVVSWLMVGPFLGVYQIQRAADIRQIWRPFYAMVLAGPMAAWLRAVMLGNTPILPMFVVVLGGISALALLAWRLIYWLLVLRNSGSNG